MVRWLRSRQQLTTEETKEKTAVQGSTNEVGSTELRFE
jgi:hypothetical protein